MVSKKLERPSSIGFSFYLYFLRKELLNMIIKSETEKRKEKMLKDRYLLMI